jgi:glycosyltransferase involved in cell wall biosynthesis
MPRHDANAAATGLLIALPGGFYVSGVVTWAVRLVNELSARGTPCGLLLHAQREGYRPSRPSLDPQVRVFDLSPLGRIESCEGRIEPFAKAYADAAQALGVSRVVLSPNLHGDSYGAAAAALQACGDLLRVVGWCHLDGAYDVHLLRHYAPMLSRVVAVSSALRERLGDLHGVTEIPYGVPATTRAPAREQGPPRLIYAGRLDETIKRVGALAAMSRTLDRQGFAHRLILVGDGPAKDTLVGGPSIEVRPGVAPEVVGESFAASDLFVLASKTEGLSLAMLEAMRCGCVPVVTRVRSGAAQAVRHGESGMLVEADDDTGLEPLARRMAAAVRGAWEAGPAAVNAMRARAMRDASSYSVEAHASRVLEMMREAASEPAKSWVGRCAFTGGGSVPAGGDQRLREVLRSLRGERVLVHGTGRHTMELGHVLEEFRDRIIGFCDDDVTKAGTRVMGLPVHLPPGPSEGTAVVVSSWIHEADVLSRANVAYAGKRVMGLYRAA